MAKSIRFTICAFCVALVLMFVGCSSSPSAEEMKQLDDLKAEVASLQKQVNDKNGEKAALEKANAEKNGKLQQCQSDQEAVKKALGNQ